MAMERILIVDDSPVEARIASNLLTGAGYATTVVRHSEEVADTARRWLPDLILLNVAMPKVDGYQLCRQLKADPAMRNTVVALCTAPDELLDELKGVEVGADDFLIRTSSREDFLSRIKQILAERRMNLAGPLEALNPLLTQLLNKRLDQRGLIELLLTTFNDHVRAGLTLLWDAYITGTLVSWAAEKTAAEFSFFPRLLQAQALGTPWEAVEPIPTQHWLEAFRLFSSRVYQLAMRLTRAHSTRLKEARVVTKVFTEMVHALSAKCQELPDRVSEPGPEAQAATVSPIWPSRQPENEQLRQALRDLPQQMDSLMATIAREVRQPLSIILQLCQSLKTEPTAHLDARTRAYLQSIEQAGRTIQALIADATRYAHLVSVPGAYREVNLSQLVEQVTQELSSTLSERGASIRITGHWPTLVCDGERVKELLTELIINAIKFNENSRPLVELGVAKESPEGYTFYVKDNGSGIEVAHYDSIFRPFCRPPQSKSYPGTGVGLAMCRRIVESHGGRIWVQSPPGAGATFFFTLPRSIRSEARSPAP